MRKKGALDSYILPSKITKKIKIRWANIYIIKKLVKTVRVELEA